jgi:hypothetical protein
MAMARAVVVSTMRHGIGGVEAMPLQPPML